MSATPADRARPVAVLFDLDGTLIDSIELILNSARHAFTGSEGHVPSDAEWLTAADEPDRQTYRGIEGLRRFVDSLGELWDDRFADVMQFGEFIERGDWVVVPWTARIRSPCRWRARPCWAWAASSRRRCA